MPYQTKPRSARRGAPQQIDLFAAGPTQKIDSVPAWSALPEGVTDLGIQNRPLQSGILPK